MTRYCLNSSRSGTGDLHEAMTWIPPKSNPLFIIDTFFQKESAFIFNEIHPSSKRIFWFDADETQKSIERAIAIWEWLVELEANRSTPLVIVGGGITLDTGAFAASTFQRGIPFTLVPTTLLAQVDASIGGKNGVNFLTIKNYLGTITEPTHVIADTRVLATLPAAHVISGWMEMVKHGLIADPELWRTLSSFQYVPRPENEPELIRTSSQIKFNIVQDDLREDGRRKILNFGHTVAHALESLASREAMNVPHGMAVGLGMVFSLTWSAQLTTENSRQTLLDAAQIVRAWIEQFTEFNCINWAASLDALEVWNNMKRDKKNRADEVLEVALKAIGEAHWDEPITRPVFEEVWQQIVHENSSAQN